MGKLAAILALTAAALGCGAAGGTEASIPAPTTYAPNVPTRRLSAYETLQVPGFNPALVWVPADRSLAQPVLVAAHGAGDRAEPHCDNWRRLTEDRAFVLCPRGVRTSAFDPPERAAYYYPTHHALGMEVMAALQALRNAYGKQVDGGPVVFAGFSQGAMMGALMAVQHGETFHRLILVEGGFDEWSIPQSERFRGLGGQKVLFACGREPCRVRAEKAASYLRKAQLDARVVYAPGAGHTPDGPVGEKVAASFDWLLEGDPRWARR